METEHTPGPWKVYERTLPHYLNGSHVMRQIFTEWHHPQAQGPLAVCGLSVGLGPEKGGPAVQFVHMSEADARLIAAAPELLRVLKRMIDEGGVRLSADYLKAFGSWPADKDIQGWEKSVWVRALDAVDDARAVIAKAEGAKNPVESHEESAA